LGESGARLGRGYRCLWNNYGKIRTRKWSMALTHPVLSLSVTHSSLEHLYMPPGQVHFRATAQNCNCFRFKTDRFLSLIQNSIQALAPNPTASRSSSSCSSVSQVCRSSMHRVCFKKTLSATCIHYNHIHWQYWQC